MDAVSSSLIRSGRSHSSLMGETTDNDRLPFERGVE
jgi:hypothetical protein